MNKMVSTCSLLLLSVTLLYCGCAQITEAPKESQSSVQAGEDSDAGTERAAEVIIYIPPTEDAETVFYYSNVDWAATMYLSDENLDRTQWEDKLRETRQIPYYIKADRRDALIREYLKEHGITQELPDGSALVDGKPLLEYYRDWNRQITCVVLHAWGMFYNDPDAIVKAAANGTFDKLSKEEQEKIYETSLQEVTYCTTLHWNQLEKIGRLAHNRREDSQIIQETFYDSEGMKQASISYEYIDGIPFSFITEYHKPESGRKERASYAVTDILNRTQRFWLFTNRAEWDENGKWLKYNGSLHSGSRAWCYYDKAGRLQSIQEESDEFGEYFNCSDIMFHYRDNGSLDTMKYSFMTARRNTYDSSGTAYYDEQGRMIYRIYYVSNGNRYCFYLYNEDEQLPWACMELCSQAYSSDDDETAYGNDCSFYIYQSPSS